MKMRTMILRIATQIMVMAIIISIVLLFIGIGVLVLIHACIVGRAFRRGLSTMTRGDTCEGTSHGLSLDDLQQLPCFEFRGGGGGAAVVVGTLDCAVCLESFQMGEKCRLLPVCKHSFHVHCVDSWLMRTPICPICRTSVDHRKIGSVSGVGIELGGTPGVVVGFPWYNHAYLIFGKVSDHVLKQCDGCRNVEQIITGSRCYISVSPTSENQKIE